MGNCQDSSCDKPITLTSEPTFAALSGESVRTVLSVPKMDSPTEEAMIRGKLGGMPGIDGLECNLMQRWLTLTHRPEALEPALRAINALGLGAAVVGASAPGEDRAQGWSMPHWKWGLLGVAALAAIAAEVLDLAGQGGRWLVIALALLAVAAGAIARAWQGCSTGCQTV